MSGASSRTNPRAATLVTNHLARSERPHHAVCERAVRICRRPQGALKTGKVGGMSDTYDWLATMLAAGEVTVARER